MLATAGQSVSVLYSLFQLESLQYHTQLLNWVAGLTKRD